MVYRQGMFARARAHLGLMLCVLAVSAAQGASTPPIDIPMRAPWSRGPALFLRQWLVLGPIPGTLEQNALSAASAEASLNPKAYEALATAAGERRWMGQTSWGNEFSVAAPLGSKEYRGTKAEPEVAYAFGVVKRERDGEAELSIGHDGRVRIWVNGAEVKTPPVARPFGFDAVRIPVTLKRGDNRILIKTEHLSGPWLLAMRVLEPGAVVPKLSELTPVWGTPKAGTLSVQTDVARDPKAPPVQVAVIGAGGKVVAQSQVSRGEVAELPIASWPDGAYDIQLVTSDSAGIRTATYRPWYKGDALAAARRALAGVDSSNPTERMLADMIRDRLGGSVESAPDDAADLIHSPLMELEELAQAKANGPGPIRPSGFVRVGYRDEVDGSTQYCRAYLPPQYDSKQRWPVILNIHGFNPPNPPYIRWWSVDQRHNSIPERLNVIYVEPHGRGNAQYLGIGERDVLNCLSQLKQRLSVDDDRVYLTGESMGGSGTWIIASRHPELFAAAAPVFGGWDYRLIPGFGFDNPKADRPVERYAQEAHSSFAGAEGLLNVPLFVLHGDSDPIVSVEFSRHAVRMLQRWGYDIRYEELPGFVHEDLNARERIAQWLLTHRREPAPRKVRVRAMELAAAQAHWVQVRSFQQALRPMRAEAEVVEPGFIRLDTDNVATIALSPPAVLRGSGNSLRVVWNGNERAVALSGQGVAVLEAQASTVRAAGAPPAKRSALLKRPELPGGLSHFFTTPFVIVVGTSSNDPEMRRLCEEKADALAQNWNTWQHTMPRVLKDSEITAGHEKQYSLLLIGGADANRVSKRIASRLPLQVNRDSVTIDGRKFAATDAVAQMVYPSPVQPDRYVLIVAATSSAGMYFWNPAGFRHPVFGFPTLPIDWSIRDGRRVKVENGLSFERMWVASGTFDGAWRRDDRYVFTGDEALRAQSPLRQAPKPGFTLPANILDSYVGTYDLMPGIAATITRNDRGLVIQIADNPPGPLAAEKQDEFAISAADASAVFERDASGAVTALVLNNMGEEYRCPKRK